MNRQRQLAGVNSYQRELGFHPLDWLRTRLASRRHESGPTEVRWLDLCCGTGRALLQAAEELRGLGLDDAVRLVGVDLVDAFTPQPPDSPVQLITASVTTWQPPGPFDLITCVHGLHYVGDKLAVITRAARTLTDDGLFIADFDATSVRLANRQPAGRTLTTALRTTGLTYDTRRHRLTRQGHRDIALPFTYLGADDHAGPNYTGQPAVHSYYRHEQNHRAEARTVR
ncbi:class I SAM-dependent methyltransferase [Frankia sp. CNm7]|uniref:Class I SAM-dependent methyltransferase n=2 Tax=Frankia nepalensis TaxID=1836974 RepID=A0A937RAN8_9ACTN|nr:class I SAM-dependent methyltransferase [Frankia nepalensis]MBL7508416.1 class I SAM-dependent methyltransferase [Frankia nepalensis]MBL7522434.1 class I SAM-dependent methyltransferase [Frankia nepalensis]MBL7626247.1 class I SAM-dependent methyltransferase [Frankia nepalensis]